MRKKTTLLALLFAMCLLFAGCSRTTLNVDVSEKAKMSISPEKLVTKDYYSSSSDKELTEKQIYSKLKKEIKKDYKKYRKTLKFKKVQKKIKGEQYYGYVVTGIKKLDGVKCYKKNGRIYCEMDLRMKDLDSQGEEEMSTEDMKEILKLLEMGGMTSKIKITFPHKPKTNYGSVKGKTVTINAMKYLQKYIGKEGKIIIISCKA